MAFGERIRLLRKEQEMSQARLASKLGVSTTTISQYETNKRFPDQEGIIGLCTFFDVSSDYLLGLSDNRNSTRIINQIIPEGNVLSDEQLNALRDLITVFLSQRGQK